MCVFLKTHFISHLVNKANPGKFALPCKVLPHDRIIISDGKETMASLIYLMCGHDPRSIVQHHQGQKPQCKDTCPSFPKRSTSLAASLLRLGEFEIERESFFFFFFFLSFPFFLIYFLLKDNCYTEFCCFLLPQHESAISFSSV